MITLVTGFNNTGKTTWIANTIATINNITHTFNIKSKEIEVINGELTLSKLESFYYFTPIGGVECDSLLYPLNTLYFNYPENGLHPSLHSKVIEKVINLHNQSYDIYIETHSDHIVNAVRVAIKQELIKCEEVKVLFFKAVDKIVEIKLDFNGQFNKRPNGFLMNMVNNLINL